MSNSKMSNAQKLDAVLTAAKSANVSKYGEDYYVEFHSVNFETGVLNFRTNSRDSAKLEISCDLKTFGINVDSDVFYAPLSQKLSLENPRLVKILESEFFNAGIISNSQSVF